MKKVAILGPGLLGGSIALGLRGRSEASVAIWGRRAEVIEEIRAARLAELASTDLKEVVRDADLVVICTPIGCMPTLAAELLPAVSAHTLVTDAGSVKAPVVRELGDIFAHRARFVGSHPMAGSEQAGWKAARADLFAGAVCIVTPVPNSDPSAVAEISTFWETLGCAVRQLPPTTHDETVALISHFPHLLAACLVDLIASKDSRAFEFAGPGLRDITRVAAGPPAMWAEILRANRNAVRSSIEAMIEKLRETATLLDRESPEAMLDFLTHAKVWRDCLH